MARDPVSAYDAQTYYEDFSLRVGQRDWLTPNPRHQQLKLLMGELLGDREGLQLADVGCGAGVMTDALCKYGKIDGVDFSTAAIAEARRLCSRANFLAGGLEMLPGTNYDVIAAFDVLEHIPATDRVAFLRDVADRLGPDGLAFFSTPFPAATRYRRSVDDPTLQIIDEEVELPALLPEAQEAGLQLVRFQAFDVFKGSPEYQAMTFVKQRQWGGPPALRPAPLQRRITIMRKPSVRRARRILFAARAMRRGDVRTAIWFLTAKPPTVNS